MDVIQVETCNIMKKFNTTNNIQKVLRENLLQQINNSKHCYRK